jgi:ABC-2 type transport system permease protein
MNSRAAAPFWRQVTMMTWRSLVTIFRTPEAIIPPIGISVFFLVIYQSTLGGASASFLPGENYLGFVLPLSIISASLSGGGIAGQSLVRDLESRYFDKLLLTPASRAGLLLGPILAGAMILLIQASVVMVVALLLGLHPATGIGGIMVLLLLSVFVGVSIAGFTVSAALGTGSAAATQGASFVFFPLTFLTASFVPLDLLEGWLQTAARLNPITYVLEAMRALMNNGWDMQLLLQGLLACALICAVTFGMALFALRVRTRRK